MNAAVQPHTNTQSPGQAAVSPVPVAATDRSYSTIAAADSNQTVNTTRSARPSAESPELRALRLAERQLFSERASANNATNHQSLDVNATESCDGPSEEWRQSRDYDIPPTPSWLKGLNLPEIPVPRQTSIAKYIRYFASSEEGRHSFTTWLIRSGRFRNIIEQALSKRGLPTDLIAIVFVESGVWPTAVSSASAAGLWQLMPQTARAYGLTVKPGFDERRSIWRSTDAAVSYLADLYSRFGSWHLALAAYNAGYDHLLSLMDSKRAEDFWSLSEGTGALPRETALYVPKVLAIATLLKNLRYFGFDGLEIKQPFKASALDVPPGVRLSIIARAAGTSLRLLREMNPEYSGEVTPDVDVPLSIHVPTRGVARAKSMLPQLIEQAEREDLDRRVTSDFDWGRDEFDREGLTRLQRTGHHTNENKDQAPDFDTPQHTRSRQDAAIARNVDAETTAGRRDDVGPTKGLESPKDSGVSFKPLDSSNDKESP